MCMKYIRQGGSDFLFIDWVNGSQSDLRSQEDGKMKYSAGAIMKTGEIVGRAFESKEEAENYLLELADKNLIKQGRIRELSTGTEEKFDF